MLALDAPDGHVNDQDGSAQHADGTHSQAQMLCIQHDEMKTLSKTCSTNKLAVRLPLWTCYVVGTCVNTVRHWSTGMERARARAREEDEDKEEVVEDFI